MTGWNGNDPGILRLPSGRLIRGRALRTRSVGVAPEFGIYLSGKHPQPLRWDARWVHWPDFRLPTNPNDAQEALNEAWLRAAVERVEVACGGGLGRTGTALACMAVIDGVAAAEAVAYVRRHYALRAVETIWQRRYVARFPAL